MVNLSIGQCLCTFVCAFILLKTEGSDDVDISFIKSAVAKGAVCLDGSPPAYQFDKGFGEGVNNWIVRIQGGAWCESVENCLSRAKSAFGSSTLMKKFNFSGVLSNKQELNPNFYNWNRVIMRYCDGSSFTGDVEEVDPATKLHFRGARIFNVTVEELLAKGMKNASNVLLYGCSSGGLATFMHCDKFRAIIPQSTKVKCFTDAGFFIHAKDVSGKYHFEEYYDKVVKLHGSAKSLPASCTSKMSPSLCFYPQFVLPQIQTPIFVMNSAYDSWQVNNILISKEADPHGAWSHCKMNISTCSTAQMLRLQDFRSDFLEALTLGVGNGSSRGWFVNTCYTHCQAENQLKRAWTIDNKTIAEAVSDWFYDRSSSQRIDEEQKLPHSCVVDPVVSSSQKLFCMDSDE